MPNQLHEYGSLNGLSYSKILTLLFNSGFRVWSSMDGLVRGPFPWTRVSLPSGRENIYRTDPQTGARISGSGDWNSNPCNFPDAQMQGFACPGQYAPPERVQWGELYQHETDSLMADVPVGMTGIEITDGANFLVLGRHPGSDTISYSKAWFHTVDTGMGQMLGEFVVKGILAAVSSGASSILLKVTEEKKPAVRPVDIDVPDEYRENFTPTDAPPPDVMAPVDPSGGDPPQDPSNPDLPEIPYEGTVKPFPWLGAGIALAALFLA